MKPRIMVLPVLAGLSLSACSNSAPEGLANGEEVPAKVEHVDGAEVSRVILSAKAAERLGIETAEVHEVPTSAAYLVGWTGQLGPRKVVAYAAVLYDANGDTWVYTNPAPLTFVRQRIRIDRIERDLAVLSEGPPVGTRVVTVGGAELFGAEFEIGH